MNVYIPYTRLPSEYQEVEYIENTGATSSSYQYIDTGINATANIKIELGITPNLSYISENAILGTDWSATTIFLMFYSSKYRLHYGGNYGDASTTITASKQDVVISNTGITVNGETTSIGGGSSYLGTGSILLFAVRGFSMNPSRYKPAVFKCHGMKMYDGNSLIRDLVPCYRKSDSVIGLYDLVNDQFYTNSGTGIFSKGNDVTMSVLKNIYIGEYGWEPGANTIAYIPLDSTNTKNDTYGGNTTTQLGTVRYGTYGGVDCADFTTGGCIYSNILNGVSTYTALIWANNINGNSASGGYGGNVFAVSKSGVNYQPGIYYGNSSSSNGYFAFYANNSSGDIYFNTNTKSHWFLLAICISSSTKKAYLFGDGSYKELDISNSSTNSQYVMIGSTIYDNLTEGTERRFYGYLSNLIIENKVRTAQEVSDYYNQTKSNYGL